MKVPEISDDADEEGAAKDEAFVFTMNVIVPSLGSLFLGRGNGDWGDEGGEDISASHPEV